MKPATNKKIQMNRTERPLKKEKEQKKIIIRLNEKQKIHLNNFKHCYKINKTIPPSPDDLKK